MQLQDSKRSNRDLSGTIQVKDNNIRLENKQQQEAESQFQTLTDRVALLEAEVSILTKEKERALKKNEGLKSLNQDLLDNIMLNQQWIWTCQRNKKSEHS